MFTDAQKEGYDSYWKTGDTDNPYNNWGHEWYKHAEWIEGLNEAELEDTDDD